jgi:hypothetical protein
MRLPRVRFTVRRMMAAMAIAGALLGAEIMRERRERFAELARVFGGTAWSARRAAENPPGTHGDPVTMRSIAEYADALQMKYARASRYPWLPVAPDPPEPR